MYELTVEAEFSAAHRLREYQGACENLHGHNWRVKLIVGGEQLNPLGMLMDFRNVKAILRGATDRFDHVFLNELPEFQTVNPTTENIARGIAEECARKLPQGVSVVSVTVWESNRASARYSPK